MGLQSHSARRDRSQLGELMSFGNRRHIFEILRSYYAAGLELVLNDSIVHE